jgi:NitT/TauT family transport system permease protein
MTSETRSERAAVLDAGRSAAAKPRAKAPPSRLMRFIDRLIAAAVLLALWQAASHLGANGKWISSPTAVAVRIWQMLLDGELAMHTWQTLQEALVGLAAGILLGGALGLALGYWRRLSDALDPVIMGLYSLPKVSLAPLFIIWFGIGLSAKVALVVSLVMFIVLYNVREGLKTIDTELVDAFRSMNASRFAMMRYVVAPSLFPWLLTAIRIGIGAALIGAVVAELVGSSRGLGWYVSNATATYDITGSITALVVLGILAMILNTALARLEAHLMAWRKGPNLGQG